MKFKKTLIFLACLALLTSAAWGVSSQTGKMQSSKSSLILDTNTWLDINQFLCFVYNDGNFCYDNANVLGKTDGLYYPRGSNTTCIYAAGIWIGAKVDDELRTVVAEFGSEFVPGPMTEDGYFIPDNASFRTYKISRGDTDETNRDYEEWPAEHGAPVDEFGEPMLLGDQMCWAVYNDADTASHNIDAGDSHPLGLEIQQTTFAFGRSGALGNVIFFKYLMINKGGNTLDSTYVSLWADPDLGGASDDLVGCDTVLSMGFCYNEAGADSDYGTSPPAVGFDFFQGPLVDGEPTDSGKFKGEWIYGKKNLPMTSFNKYINQTDPHSNTEAFNYMRGLDIDGFPQTDPFTGDTTLFMHAGDPVTGEGWLDDNAADRRYMMTTGPFVMEPGDTQEIVAAIVVGQGNDRLASIIEMKTNDLQAQTVFDLNFDIPSPPPNPTVYTRGYDNAIDLVWTTDPEDFVQDYVDKLDQYFVFEGYNIYQGESPTGPWTKVATYDYEAAISQRMFEDTAGADIIVCEEIDEVLVCDTFPRAWDFMKLYATVVNTVAGGPEIIITQSGSDAGLVNHLHIDRSYLDGGPIINNYPYHFAVVSYGVNIQEVFSEDSVFIGPNFVGFNAEALPNSN